MISAEFIIDSYVIVHFSDVKPEAKAIILLLNAEKNARTTLYFVSDEIDLAETNIIQGTDNSSAYYHIRRFSEIIDILRNEKPLTSYALMSATESGFVRVYAGHEPIGEGEI